jgi:hypothetical protein
LQFGVLGDLRLIEQDAALRVDAAGNQRTSAAAISSVPERRAAGSCGIEIA